jgi:hypothetical protein
LPGVSISISTSPLMALSPSAESIQGVDAMPVTAEGIDRDERGATANGVPPDIE